MCGKGIAAECMTGRGRTRKEELNVMGNGSVQSNYGSMLFLNTFVAFIQVTLIQMSQ
jgi:hypothetical protein